MFMFFLWQATSWTWSQPPPWPSRIVSTSARQLLEVLPSLSRRQPNSLEVVLQLAQLGHNGDRVRLAGGFLNLGVLLRVSQPTKNSIPPTLGSYLRPHEHIVRLLVTNGKLALRLLVLFGERLQGLDRPAGEDRETELGVGSGVFVTGLDMISICWLRDGDGGHPKWLNSQKRACHPAATPRPRSAPCASLRRCLQRTCRSLHTQHCQISPQENGQSVRR